MTFKCRPTLTFFKQYTQDRCCSTTVAYCRKTYWLVEYIQGVGEYTWPLRKTPLAKLEKKIMFMCTCNPLTFTFDVDIIYLLNAIKRSQYTIAIWTPFVSSRLNVLYVFFYRLYYIGTYRLHVSPSFLGYK